MEGIENFLEQLKSGLVCVDENGAPQHYCFYDDEDAASHIETLRAELREDEDEELRAMADTLTIRPMTAEELKDWFEPEVA